MSLISFGYLRLLGQRLYIRIAGTLPCATRNGCALYLRSWLNPLLTFALYHQCRDRHRYPRDAPDHCQTKADVAFWQGVFEKWVDVDFYAHNCFLNGRPFGRPLFLLKNWYQNYPAHTSDNFIYPYCNKLCGLNRKFNIIYSYEYDKIH